MIVKGGMEGWRQRRGKGRKEGERKEIRGKRIKYGKKKSGHTFRPSLPPKHLSGPSCSCRHTDWTGMTHPSNWLVLDEATHFRQDILGTHI